MKKQGKLAPAVLLCIIATISMLALYFSERVFGKDRILGFRTTADVASAGSRVGSSKYGGVNYVETVPIEYMSSTSVTVRE